MIITITVFGVSIAGFLLGLTILVRDPRSSYHRVFALFTFILGLWMIANYYSQSTSSSSIFFFADFALAPLLAYVFLHYGVETLQFYLPRIVIRPLERIVLLAAGFIAIIMSAATILGQVTVPTERGDIVYADARLLYIPYILLLGVMVLCGMLLFLYAFFKTNIEYKRQARLVFSGLSLGAALLVFSNAVLPAVTSKTTGLVVAQELSYIAILIMIVSLTYSVVRYRMFDVRLVVARSVAYLLLITSLVGLYGLVVFGAADMFLGDTDIAKRIVPILAALLLVFTTPYLRVQFDRITNRLFYQDAYEPQLFLDELNRVLVSTIDLNNLLKLSTEVIEQNLKAEFCVFGLKETDFAEQRIVGNTQRKFDYQDISFARATTPQMDHKVIVADHLDESNKELRGKMRRNDVAVLARLTSDVDQEGIGYIVLGAKKSGNPYNSQDIRVLETIANAMVIAIDNALRFEEIQKFNITLEKRVEDATRRLQRANDKLIALDQTKDDFISMASHQLRTPLTSVKGYLSMVLEGDAGKLNAQQSKLLDQAFISSQRMVYLIADLLNVSRLRTGKFVIETAEVNLAEVVQGEVAQLVDTAAARNLKLSYKMPKSFPTLMLDETKIRQVIMNFIDNAIYYTPSGGKIDVSLLDDGKMVEFRVHDSGIGVPKSEQHNLFNKFFRAGNARKARPDGTGLGLFMAKKVVVAQGGAVVFESTEGKGSTFGFTFEKAKLAPGES